MHCYTFTMFFCFYFTTVIEINLQIDLAVTLSQPFARPQARQIYGIFAAFLVSTICGIAIFITDFNVNAPLNQVIFYSIKLVFFLTATYSVSTVLHSFRKKGLSKQFRALLFKRHVSFCILTIFCQITSMIDFMQMTCVVDFPAWVQAFCCYYFVATAFILAILRLNEPIVLNTFKRDIMCCSIGRANADVSLHSESFYSTESSFSAMPDMRKGSAYDNEILTDTLNGFLTSSLNVELVYTILKGIRRIVKTPDLETWKNGQVPESDANDFSMKLTLDNIKIRNFKIWEEAHQQ